MTCTGCGGPRTSRASRCTACATKARREHRQKNPEQTRAYLREWAKRNPEKVKANSRRNYERHTERFKEQARRWGKANPEKRSAIMVFQNAKRRSRIKANGGRGFTKQHFVELLDRVGGLCSYCRDKQARSIDHFVPLALGGLHDYANIVPACRDCNSKKRENDPIAWIVESFGLMRLAFVRSVMLKSSAV